MTDLGTVGKKPRDFGLWSWGWWETILQVLGDHTLEWWVAVFGIIGDNLWNGQWAYNWKMVTILWVKGYHQGDGRWPYKRRLVTILCILGDHLSNNRWLFVGWCMVVLVMKGDHHGDGGWQSLWALWPYLGRLVPKFWMMAYHPWDGGCPIWWI